MLDEGQRAGDERLGLVALTVKAGNAQRLFDAALAARAAHEHDDVDGFRDEVKRRAGCDFKRELFKPGQCAEGRIGMKRGDAAGVTSVPGFEKVKSFRPANLADHNSIGAKPQR